MIRALIRNKSFMVGFSFIMILLIASIVWPILTGGEIKQITAEYDNGNIVSVSPYPPSREFFLGSDENGKDYLQMLVFGAKFTLAGVAGTALLQIGLTVLLGCLIGAYAPRLITKIEPFFDSFNFLPLVVFAYFILQSVLSMPLEGFKSTLAERILFQIVLLALLGLPPLVFYTANEVKKAFQKEFVQAAAILGGGRIHLLLKHVIPEVRGMWMLLFIQQMLQIMLILMTLGLFGIYFGGTIMNFSTSLTSTTYEWTGFLGGIFRWINSNPWMTMAPIYFISCTTLAFRLMAIGFENTLANYRQLAQA